MNTRQPGLLTLTEAAEYLGIPASTLQTWRSRRPGYGPHAVKIGSRVRYRPADLDAWIEGLDAA